MPTDNNIYLAILQKVGSNIKTMRQDKHMNQKELAFACDMEKAGMSRIESGKSNITFFTLCRISEALNIPIIDIIGGAQAA